MKIVDDRTKKEFHYRVKSIVEHRCEPDHPGLCLYWAYYAIKELAVLGIKGVLQAGDAAWMRVTQEHYVCCPQDMNTHFGYKWEPGSPESRAAMALGALPEIHIWVGIVENQEIVDLTTGCWPEACKRLLGLDWETTRPPEFFWGKPEELPAGAHYIPSAQATIFVGRLLDCMEKKGLIG